MNMRKEFEAWFNSNYLPHNMEFLHLVNSYTSNKVNAFWECWQAALAALVSNSEQQAQQSQWISVEERLPELDKEVICVFFDGTMMCRRLCAYTEDGWYSYDERIWEPVLYWAELDALQLPPAPEGVE